MSPRIWAKMVATQNESLCIESNPQGDFFDKLPEVGWRHPRIAAFLIDLIASGFDQNIRTGGDAFQQSGLDD